MDALLRFHSAELEAQFWASAPVRATLLSADRAALYVCIFNNALASYMLTSFDVAEELDMHYKWAAFFVTAQLLSTWCAARTAAGGSTRGSMGNGLPCRPPPALICGTRSLSYASCACTAHLSSPTPPPKPSKNRTTGAFGATRTRTTSTVTW